MNAKKCSLVTVIMLTTSAVRMFREFSKRTSTPKTYISRFSMSTILFLIRR